MNIHESAEDYLEAILKLRESCGMVRSIDIVRELEYSKPSVSVAMKNLRENGYIQMDEDGFITLLPPGEEIAQRIYGRHKLLTQLFIRLGVSPETAAVDACKIEHDLSEETYEKIKAHAAGGKDTIECDSRPMEAPCSKKGALPDQHSFKSPGSPLSHIRRLQ